MKANIALACTSIFYLGCTVIPTVNTTITRISATAYQSKAQDCDIQILTQMPTDRKYEELAILNSVTDQGTFTHKDLNSMLPFIKAKACELGADAIVIKNIEQGGTPRMDDFNTQTPTKAFCVAIKFVL